MSDNVSRTPEENEKVVAEGFIEKAHRTLGRIPFTDEAVAAYYCATDDATPGPCPDNLDGGIGIFHCADRRDTGFYCNAGFH